MKRLVDYNLTEQEIRQIFGSQESYDTYLELFAKYPDSEKVKIACVLFLRGKKEESLKMIESIEDEEYRRCCLQDEYGSWVIWEKGWI